MINQKGFSGAILILIIVLFSSLVAIIGGYFVKTQYFDQPGSDRTEDNTINDLPIEGKVLFVSKVGDMSIASPDGKNATLVSSNKVFNRIEDGLPPIVIGISPDASKILFASYVKYDPANPDNPDYKIGNSRAYYLSSLNGKNLQKIDLTKFAKLGTSMVFLAGWSVDGNKIVFSGIIPQPSGPAKTMFGDYDPVSEEIRPIYTSDSPKAGNLMYYDSQKTILVFNSQLPGNGDPTGKGYKIDLQTQKIEEFNRPALSFGNSGMSSYIPYFVSSNSDFSSNDRKNISVYSYDQPNAPIAQINLDDPKSNFTNNYVWSPKYSYFAIASGYSEEKNGKIEFYRELNIYTRDGKKVMSREINPFDFYSGSLFSPDESKFLMIGITTQKEGLKIDIPIWQVINVKTGKQLSDRIISEDLGLYTVKWLK